MKCYHDPRRKTIRMIKYLDQALCSFKGCFSRLAAFKWFVTIVIGMMIRSDTLGVTSVIRALGLKPDYEALVKFFRSNAWKLRNLESNWRRFISGNAPLLYYNNSAVLAGDGIKVSKEGLRIPGVKRLHQESGDSSKAANINGQMYGSVGVLAGTNGKTFCIPLACELQDGVKEIMSWNEAAGHRQNSHTVELISLAHRMTREFPNAILLLDRYFLTVPALERLDAFNAGGGGLRSIIMVKMNAVAYEQPDTYKTGLRGRPPLKGKTIKLAELFETESDRFDNGDVNLYGKKVDIRFLVKDLLWGKGLYRKMRFVLVEYDKRRSMIASTDTNISAIDIISLYSKRFSIEATFKTMKQDVSVFSNRFWSHCMPKYNKYAKTGAIDRNTSIKKPRDRKLVRKTLDAVEGYVFCGVVATGLLQMLSIAHSKSELKYKFRFLRSKTKTVESEATIADYFRKNIFRLLINHKDLAISKIIIDKIVTDESNYVFEDTA